MELAQGLYCIEFLAQGLYCIEFYCCFVGFAYLPENSIYFFGLSFKFNQGRDLVFVQSII